MKKNFLFFYFCHVVLFIQWHKKASQRPNIVYILAQDRGYGDLACNGQQK